MRLLSVIIPARDEEGCVASTVEHLHLELDLRGVPHEIIVVDDGSTDRTWEILQEEARRLNVASSNISPTEPRLCETARGAAEGKHRPTEPPSPPSSASPVASPSSATAVSPTDTCPLSPVFSADSPSDPPQASGLKSPPYSPPSTQVSGLRSPNSDPPSPRHSSPVCSTGEELSPLRSGSRHRILHCVQNPAPHGFGRAITLGLDTMTGDAAVIFMADESDDCRDVVRYWEKLNEGYDCVFGSRFMKGGGTIDYPPIKLFMNRLANAFVRFLFRHGLNDTTNAFKAYRKEVIDGIRPILSPHFNITVELPLKAIVRGYNFAVIPITWRNRRSGVAKLKIREMGSRYLFIVLYVWLEKYFSRGDYKKTAT